MSVEKTAEEIYDDAFVADAETNDDSATTLQDEELRESPAEAPNNAERSSDNDGARVVAPAPENTDTASDGEPENWRAKFEKSEQRMRSWNGRLREKDKEIAALNDALAAYKTDSADIDDPDLKQLSEDYPDIAAPMLRALRRQANAAVQPLVAQQTLLGQQQHFASIRSVHPDFEQISQSDAFEDWRKAQPAFIQAEIDRISEEGTANEVVSLFDTYKQAREAAEAQANSGKRDQKLSRQIENAQGVKARQGMIPAPEADPNDFDAAWNSA